MSKLEIRKIGITSIEADAVVNAANEGLWEGGGVCGAIFRAAGSAELTKACNEIGGCRTGGAVITPAFGMKTARHIIHAVGPVWQGGDRGEDSQLYDAYENSLQLAKDNGCRSIAFPLISAGIFGYPLDGAWRKAIQACRTFMEKNPDYELDIYFAILEDRIIRVGQKTVTEIMKDR